MNNDSNTTDPRVEAGAKAWDKHMGGRYAPDEVEELAEEVAVILAAADAVDPRQPRTITTVEELDALPVGSVVLRNGRAFQRFAPRSAGLYEYRMWQCTDGGFVRSTKDGSSILPATVLHEPETEAAEVGIDECNGSGRCEVSKHVHGCYSDLGRCDEPTEHEGTR